jgi:hypothetical protein
MIYSGYQDWLKRPESERNAEAMRCAGYEIWADLNGREHWRKMEGDTLIDVLHRERSPCTDRNATDILLAEVERRGKAAILLALLGNHLDPQAAHAFGGEYAAVQVPFSLLRAPASMLTWAACEACEEEA